MTNIKIIFKTEIAFRTPDWMTSEKVGVWRRGGHGSRGRGFPERNRGENENRGFSREVEKSRGRGISGNEGERRNRGNPCEVEKREPKPATTCLDLDGAEKDSLAEDDGLGTERTRAESEAEPQNNIQQKQALSYLPTKCRVGDTSGSSLVEVTKPSTELQGVNCVNIQQEDAITLPTEADKFPVSEKTAIGQVADWNAPEVKDIDHCLNEPTECEELAMAPTHPVGGEQEIRAQVKTPAAHNTMMLTS